MQDGLRGCCSLCGLPPSQHLRVATSLEMPSHSS